MSQARRCLLLCALLLGGLMTPLTAASAATGSYGVESAEASLSTTQAGAHADFTASFKLFGEGTEPNGRTKDVIVTLPPGLIGNPQDFPRCSVAQLGELPADSKCPQDAQVGIAQLILGGGVNGTLFEPVYNMYSPGGDIVARFGLFAGPYPSVINVRVNPVDYSLIAKVEGAPSAAQLLFAATTFWGVPASSIHDGLRLTPEEALHGKSPAGGRSSEQPERPFLSNPTECGVSRKLTVTAISYQAPDSPSTKSADFPVITGCDKLSFNPVFQATPTNPEAAAPTGLEAVLQIPQSEAPSDLATATLRSAQVTLPEGFTVNSSAADGLEGCSPEQVGFGTTDVAHCPDAAKLGSVELDVPALERTLHGAVYQRTPEPGHLFRFWLVTDEQGVHLKLPAEIEADPLTGQLTTVFSGIASLGGNPQVPFEELRLHISGGPRAPLATPSNCGTYSTAYSFAPWSGKPPASGGAPMQISTGCGKGGFSPKLQAGTISPRAGSFSPFTLTLTRQDGEANPSSLAVHLPQGLLAKLGGVPLCPEEKTAAADCPDPSKVGSIAAAAGVGGAPLWIPQPGKAPTAVYLAGPYKGAPYSIVTRVPAQAGPFDLGTVVNRAGIYVDPETATATIKTDPLPQILQGVPIAYRTIHVDVDRKGFTLNPTSCAAKEIRATVVAVNNASATPSAGFQATNCAKLGFKPKLSIKLKGGTKRGAHPALHAVLTTAAGQNEANIAKAVVTLPHSEFLEQAHIRTICTRVQFVAENCPKGSVYGYARAKTPLLDRPLAGPVYLRSSNHPLPDLVAALDGPIDVNLVGRIDAVNGGIRTTFASVPDAPVSRFVLSMQGGQKGLLVNSTNICQGRHRAKSWFSAQNERQRLIRPVLSPPCHRHRKG